MTKERISAALLLSCTAAAVAGLLVGSPPLVMVATVGILAGLRLASPPLRKGKQADLLLEERRPPHVRCARESIESACAFKMEPAARAHLERALRHLELPGESDPAADVRPRRVVAWKCHEGRLLCLLACGHTTWVQEEAGDRPLVSRRFLSCPAPGCQGPLPQHVVEQLQNENRRSPG